MKRFIDLGDQTGNCDKGEKEFAFYCTITGTFEEFDGSSTWTSIEDFTLDIHASLLNPDRYFKLIPIDWKCQ